MIKYSRSQPSPSKGPGRRNAALTLAFAAAAFFLVPDVAPAQDVSTMEDSRPGVAVFPFENGGSYGPDSEQMDALTVGIQQMLLTELDRNSELRIVERGMLRELLEEQDLGVEGRIEPGTAAEIGRLVGARYAVLGAFVDLYGDFRMDARVVDVETGEILTATEVRDEREQLFDMLFQLSQKLTAAADLPPLDRRVQEEREEREVPAEAIILYSQAQTYEDFGDMERAANVYRQIIEDFPQMVEAEQALHQISGA